MYLYKVRSFRGKYRRLFGGEGNDGEEMLKKVISARRGWKGEEKAISVIIVIFMNRN